MHVDKKIINNNLVLKVQGDFDLMITDQIRTTVEESLQSHPINNIIFNLEKVNFIDSSGLGVILGRYKELSQRGGKVVLVNPRPQVVKILELSGLLKIMNTYSDEDEAIGQF